MSGPYRHEATHDLVRCAVCGKRYSEGEYNAHCLRDCTRWSPPKGEELDRPEPSR